MVILFVMIISCLCLTLTKSFNLGTTDKPKNILLASDLTHDERAKMEEIIKKEAESICLGL